VHATHAQDRAKEACADPNITMREHAVLALRALGDAKAACPLPATTPIAKDLGPPPPSKILLSTDAGELSIVLDGDLAPVTSARVVELAKSGFYKGIACHRVVPGFVVQFGDPLGDGYGGSGTLLRSETSPKPFNALDVGVALAGRDTGSSQLFVTLSRYAHLDGEYPHIGHAEGDWYAVAEGDIITDVRVSAP
jgi:cyclophilin family peptidyl-prolyl cis-trans isomerase